MIIATGNDKTIPQNPAIIPPADTAKITNNGCNLFVLPYTFGPITFPSKIGHIIHINTVNKNNLVLITDDTNKEITATIKPPNHGIIADIPESNPKTNQLGCPIRANASVYSIIWIIILNPMPPIYLVNSLSNLDRYNNVLLFL